MKKITFLLLAIIPVFGFSQTFDFTNSDDGWDVLSGFSATNNASSMTLTTVDGDGTKKNPTIGTLAAGVVTGTNSFVGITLKNSSAMGPDYLRVSYPKPGSGRFYVNLDITTGDTDFVTYWFDLSSAVNWVGTMDDIKLHFKTAGNSDYVLPDSPNNITIEIDKIEFAASIPTTPKNSYQFNINNDTEGFSATNGSITGPTGGVLTFEPVATKFAKLDQLVYHVDASVFKQIHITLKNNSALNDQLRFISENVPNQTQTMTTSDSAEKTYSFDMSSVAEWTGNKTFTIGIGSLADGKATDNGTVEISSIVIDNTLSSSDGLETASFAIYPNPATSQITINGIQKISEVSIFDVMGKQVLRSNTLINNQLNINQLNSGVYLVRIQDVNNFITVKRIIKK
ncbi:T9SS type A sorting domain-containing protein [Tamlana sp. s12]|uniref:T9SS type A sorting domain-containing protein n=1 Tax=Tamlana sp. s12 TaxID=1630406 RepID=UPI0008388A0D|nr:T9SS type A sorting domain-containing protein [Tamlana sp. s12]QQY81694.1 T9SS type A sorting domain-containing protein [Tamlana sp. s12]